MQAFVVSRACSMRIRSRLGWLITSPAWTEAWLGRMAGARMPQELPCALHYSIVDGSEMHSDGQIGDSHTACLRQLAPERG